MRLKKHNKHRNHFNLSCVLSQREYVRVTSEINTNHELYKDKPLAIHYSIDLDNRCYAYFFKNYGFNQYFPNKYSIYKDIVEKIEIEEDKTMEELITELNAVPDSYFGFVMGIVAYANKKPERVEKIKKFIDTSDGLTTTDIVGFVMKQSDFHKDGLLFKKIA